MEKVFGDGDLIPFPEVGLHMSRFILSELGAKLTRGEINIPNGLQDEFPELYKLYMPEAFGSGHRR
jgi:hypothetical protein